jgi:hypothetical protein
LLLKVEWSEQITGSGQSQMKQSFVLWNCTVATFSQSMSSEWCFWRSTGVTHSKGRRFVDANRYIDDDEKSSDNFCIMVRLSLCSMRTTTHAEKERRRSAKPKAASLRFFALTLLTFVTCFHKTERISTSTSTLKRYESCTHDQNLTLRFFVRDAKELH